MNSTVLIVPNHTALTCIVIPTGFAKALLEVGDDFERAIQAVPKGTEPIADPVAVLKVLVEGTFC